MNTTPRKFYAAEDGNNPYPGCKILTAENPNGQNSTSSGQPDKKLTPMAAHIEWLKKERKTLYEFGYDVAADRISAAIDNATSLLEAEREMGESTWDDAYAVGCVVGGNDYTNEQDEDTGFHYFTQNYRQQ